MTSDLARSLFEAYLTIEYTEGFATDPKSFFDIEVEGMAASARAPHRRAFLALVSEHRKRTPRLDDPRGAC